MALPARIFVPALVVAGLAAQAPAQSTERLNLDNAGQQSGQSIAEYPAVSGNGRYVAFKSFARLTHGAGTSAIYVRDRQLAHTELVSVGVGGAPNDGVASHSAISFDGRHVAFESGATNLVAGDTNGTRDVFVRDRVTGTTTRVSVATGGAESHGDTSGGSDTTLDISADGRFVVFESRSPDLVAGDTNGMFDVFLHDLQTGVTERVSLSGAGGQGDWDSRAPKVSADGRYVVFHSLSTNLVGARTATGFDVFRRDRLLGTTTLESVGNSGLPARRESKNPGISGDGRFVVFESRAGNLDPTAPSGSNNEIYLRDTVAGTTVRVSRPLPGQVNNGWGRQAVISLDGDWVAFEDFSSVLVPNDSNNQRDVFRWNRATGVIELVNLGPGGVQASNLSKYPSISADGAVVAFQSWAPNLVVPDANGSTADVYARQL